MLDVIYVPIPWLVVWIFVICSIALLAGLLRMLIEYWIDLHRIKENKKWYADHPKEQPNEKDFNFPRTEDNKLWLKSRSFAVLLTISVILGLILLGDWISNFK